MYYLKTTKVVKVIYDNNKKKHEIIKNILTLIKLETILWKSQYLILSLY